MESSKLTLGPWIINGTFICAPEPQLPGRESDEFPDGTFMLAESVFNDANARLIAAARDILASLKLARRTIHTYTPWEDGARIVHSLGVIDAAIAKAEGRS